MNKRLKKKMANKQKQLTGVVGNGIPKGYAKVIGNGRNGDGGIGHGFETGEIVQFLGFDADGYADCWRDIDGLNQTLSPFHLEMGNA